MRYDILKFSGLLLAGLLLEFWLVWLSPLNLPERIYFGYPGDLARPSVKIGGLLLVAVFLTILIIAEKKSLRTKPDLNILNLTLFGAFICFIAEIFFQAIRQPFIDQSTPHSHLYYFFLAVISVSLFGTALSFFIAFQLKTKRTGRLILLILAFGLIIKCLTYFLPTLVNGN